ncbi:MAG: GNAT family N-acetyltransferase [Pseudomonadota bacterium]
MASETVFRAGAEGDLAQIEAIVAAAYSVYVERIGARPKPMDADYADALREGVVWVAEIDEQVAGFVILRSAPNLMLLENVAVSPAFQGRGLGRRFIAFAEERARAAGVPKTILYTHVKMTENVSLYRRHGFEVLEERTEHGLQRVYMEKAL